MAQFGEPGYTPEQLKAAKDTVTGPPVGTGPAPGIEGQVADGTPTVVDINALLAQLQAQQEAMAAEIQRLKAGQAPTGEHPLILTALQTRDLIAQHFAGTVLPAEKTAPVLRLADDVADAARNAVASGDTGPVRQLAQRLDRALARVHPGPGDHHYYTVAVAGAGIHMQDAADAVTGPAPSSAGAVAGGAPVRVVAGSVTG